MAYPHTSAPAEPGYSLGKRIDAVGWAVFLILTGVVWLFPETRVPPGTWLVGTGLLLLGLNAVRAISKVPVSGFATVLGMLALAGGLGALWGVRLPLVAIGLILLGLGLLTRTLTRRA